MANAGSKVGIYTTENRWGGPQFKRTGMVTCKGGRGHSWYRWQPTNRSEVDGDDPWLYWHECSVMGCDAKEYAADLPDLHDVLTLVAFLDQCGVPANAESLLDRVRDFYHTCVDAVNKYRDRMGELPYIIDPRQNPFIEGWERALVHTPLDKEKDPTGRAAALFEFRRWAEAEDKRKGFPPKVP